MPAVFRDAGWDPEFEPSHAAYAQWKDAMSFWRAFRPSAIGIAMIALTGVMHELLPEYMWPLLVVIVVGFSIWAISLAFYNWRVRHVAETRLLSEYEAWLSRHSQRSQKS